MKFASKSSLQFDFHGRIFLVTGGASGIGRETALAFGRAGAQVIVSDRSEEGVQTARTIEESSGKALYIQCDVSEDAQVLRLFDEIRKRWGRLDGAFNNAGIEGEQATTGECSTENWDRVLSVNLRGLWLCMKAELQLMVKQEQGGVIVNNSSIAGLVGFKGIPAYVASKHAVVGLTKTAALEYAEKRIRINAVCPGVIQTPMIDRFVHGEAQALNALRSGEPIGRLGKPEEIASAVLWLCSSGASFVTGHPLVVDGGWVAQ